MPQISFDHSVVLEPLLALSAMHLHSYVPSDTRLQTLVPMYLDRTLTKYREMIPTMDDGPPSLAEPLYLAALILVDITWIFSHRLDRESVGAPKLPLQTYYFLQGAAALFNKKTAYLEDLGYPCFEQQPALQLPEEMTIEQAERFDLIKADLARLLNGFDVDHLPGPRGRVYHGAVNFISKTYKAVLLGDTKGSILVTISTMPLRVDNGEFLRLLEVHDPLAMALFARSMALLRLVKNFWWLHGTGEYDVFRNEVNSIRELLPTSSLWSIHWLCKLVDEQSRDGFWTILSESLNGPGIEIESS